MRTLFLPLVFLISSLLFVGCDSGLEATPEVDESTTPEATDESDFLAPPEPDVNVRMSSYAAVADPDNPVTTESFEVGLGSLSDQVKIAAYYCPPSIACPEADDVADWSTAVTEDITLMAFYSNFFPGYGIVSPVKLEKPTLISEEMVPNGIDDEFGDDQFPDPPFDLTQLVDALAPPEQLGPEEITLSGRGQHTFVVYARNYKEYASVCCTRNTAVVEHTVTVRSPFVELKGPEDVMTGSYNTWTAVPHLPNGVTATSYEWRFDGQTVGTSSQYTRYVASSAPLQVIVETSNGDTLSRDIYVNACGGEDDPCNDDPGDDEPIYNPTPL